MTKFNTGNPVGSSDPRDLFDNAAVADRLVTGDASAYNDRLGKPRKSWQGIESEFAAFIAAGGYVGTGADGAVENYAAGIEITGYNQIVRDASGEFWRLSGPVALPYTTTGAGLPEGGAFVAVGDAALRQELNGTPSSGQGAALVKGATIYVGSVAEDFSGLAVVEGQQVVPTGWHAGSEVGGGTFVGRATVAKSQHNGITHISPTVPAVSAQTGSTIEQRVENFRAGAGETDATGTGVFVKTYADTFSYYDAGGRNNELSPTALTALEAVSRETLIPDGTLLFNSPVSLENDKKLTGFGGEFTSILQANADTSILTSALPTSRTRVENIQAKGRLSEGFADASFLVDLSDIFISHFRDCHFGYAKNVLRVRGDEGSGTASATSALFFDNCTFQYADADGLLEHIDGQYSVHHNQCTFERTIGGGGNAQVRVDSINATFGRPFNKVSYNQCHIEECDFTFNAQGCSITDSLLGESSVVMTDLSQTCQVTNNSVASVGGFIVDAGYKNKFDGVWRNTDFNGVRNAGLPERGQIVYDSGFYGNVDDEYFMVCRKWPQTVAELTDSFFTGQIEIVNGAATPAVLESSGTFTVRESLSDSSTHSKITKQIKTYLETVRVDSTGKLDTNNSSETLALQNKLKNGTFKANAITDWLTVDTVTAEAGTVGTRIGSANYSWGIYQDVPTIPGRNYVAVIKGDSAASNKLWLGDAWDGSRGKRRALSASYEMDGAFYGFIYFEAIAGVTRISIGDLAAGYVDVKWVAVADVSDNKLYASQAPSAGVVLADPVYNTNRVTGEPIAWIYKDATAGWVQFGGTYP